MSDTWDKVRNGLSSFAPLLGSALGPAGGAIGALIGNVLGVNPEPASIAAALENATPETQAKLIELQENNRHEIAKLAILRDTADIEAGSKDIANVNASMQAETAQGHPWSGAWRPFWGFVSAVAFAVSVLGVFILAYKAFTTDNAAIFFTNLPMMLGGLTALFSIPGAILGVASWHRGKKQRIEAGETAKASVMDAVLSRVMK